MSKQIYVRLGFSDVVITKEQNEDASFKVESEPYLIGYELEDGTECDEDGNPLNE